MAQDQQGNRNGDSKALEGYLAELHKALGVISVGDKAEIITEIKSHILASLERNEGLKIEDALESMGEPQEVANRYIMERGLKPAKGKTRGLFKWVMYGTAAMLALLVISVGALIYLVTPLISVDEKEDRVRILGGLIDVNGKEDSVRVGPMSFKGDGQDSATIHINGKTIKTSLFNDKAGRFAKHSITGERPIVAGQALQLMVPFSNGEIKLTTSKDKVLRWDCDVSASHPNLGVDKETKGQLTLDLADMESVDCEIEIPEKGVSATTVKGGNGDIVLDKVRSEIKAELGNGRVSVNEDSTMKYNYKTKIVNGTIDAFTSSTEVGAVPVSISVVNGQVRSL